jgi:hypothetical protein
VGLHRHERCMLAHASLQINDVVVISPKHVSCMESSPSMFHLAVRG